MVITPMNLCTLSKQPAKELPDIKKDQSGDAVRSKARILRLPNTLSPHDEIPRVLSIAVIFTSAPSYFSQGPSRVKTNHLHHTTRTVVESGSTCAGSNGGRTTAVLTTVAARGWRWGASIAI